MALNFACRVTDYMASMIKGNVHMTIQLFSEITTAFLENLQPDWTASCLPHHTV